MPAATRDFLLSDADRAFRAEVREVLARELAPRAPAIERDEWDAMAAAVRAIGDAGLLAPMFGDRSGGGLTRATAVAEEAAAISYAFEM